MTLTSYRIDLDPAGTPTASRIRPAAVAMRQDGQTIVRDLDPASCGIVIVDAWDRHWCTDLSDRMRYRGGAIGPVVDHCRAAGMPVIWAPAATTKRTSAESAAEANAANLPTWSYPSAVVPDVPGDFFTGKTYTTCITGEEPEGILKHLHDQLKVAAGDYWLVTPEILWNVIQADELTTLFYAGFAANNCAANRPYGLMAMRARGIEAHLIRDLTDLDKTFTDPPLTNDEALDGWVASVESVIGPTVTAAELLRAF